MIDIKTMAKKIKTGGGQMVHDLASEGSKYIKEKAPVIKSEAAEKAEIIKSKMSDVAKTAKAKASELSADMANNFSDFEKKPQRKIDDGTSVVDSIIDEISKDQKGAKLC